MLRYCLVFSLATSLCAQQRKASGAPAPGEDWVILFNGKDLTNWKSVGNEKWTVEDGVLHGQGVTKEYGYLATEKTYKDFHLFLRFKCLAGGNSGVYFHADFKPGTIHITGRQIEIDRNIGRHSGGVYGDDRGWWAWPAPENELVIRPYDWNDMLIRVEGNRYRVRLNNVEILDYTHPAPKYHDGVIALQLHSGGEGNMMFKDIWIRDLTRR